jgi:hypothetical protein
VRAAKTFTDDSDAYRLAAHLRDAILAHKPDARVPRDSQALQVWARSTDALLRIDKREMATALRVVDWATTDSFWQANILSPGKLREKFDALELQIKRERGTNDGRSAGRDAGRIGAGQPGATGATARGPRPPDPNRNAGYEHLFTRP